MSLLDHAAFAKVSKPSLSQASLGQALDAAPIATGTTWLQHTSRWLSVSICAPSVVTPCKSSNKTAAFSIRKLKALLVEITDRSGSCTSISADADLVPWEGKHEEESLHGQDAQGLVPIQASRGRGMKI